LTDGVYLGVETVTRDSAGFQLGGDGRPVEYAVTMRRLPDTASLKKNLNGNWNIDVFLDDSSRKLVEFYQQANTGETIAAFGSREVIQKNCEENFSQLAGFLDAPVHARRYHVVKAATEAFLQRNKTLFQRRIAENKIRDCHGDLRCGHIYQWNGVQVIDCIEFNQRFRYQDIACDLAFLVMDLDFYGHGQAALELLRRYVNLTGDRDLMGLIDFYKCYRAMVRVKIDCFRLTELDRDDDPWEKQRESIHRHMDLAYRYAVKMSRPVIWVVCGMIAAGKSTISERLSGLFSISHIRSDEVRKTMFGVPATETADTDFREGMYSAEATALVYGKMLLAAQEKIETGDSVVLDATYRSRDFRREVIQLSQDARAYLIFVECRSTEAEIKRRLEERAKTPGVSDARLKHYEQMKRTFEPLDEIPPAQYISLDTRAPVERSLEALLTQEHDRISRQAENLIG
jgi:hypothetical protein